MPPDLTPLGQALYDELARRWQDGGRKPFLAPHRELAELLGCSAAAIPRHMRALERARLIWREEYKNKFLISLPDGGAFETITESITDRSADDPPIGTSALNAPEPRPTPPKAAESGASFADPEIDHILPHMVHESMQQQQIAGAREAVTDGRTALRAALADDDAELVATILERLPQATLRDFEADLAAVESRPNVFCPRAVVLKAWSRGERVTGARAAPPPAPPGPDPTPAERPRYRKRGAEPDRAIDPVAAVAQYGDLIRLGSDTSGLAAPPSGPPVVPRHLLDKARRLVPEAADHELPDLAMLVAAGASEALLRSELALIRRREGSYAA